MNIKKKISFLALILISNFILIGEVKATTYYRYGETNGVALFSTDSNLASTEETNYKAYRFTFVNANGSIVEGTKPVDIWFSGNYKPWNYGGTYYKSYKFDQTQYDISHKEVAISSCSNDECYMSGIINYYKNNTSQFRTKLLNETENSSFDEGEFLVVEKLYTINIKTATIKSISRGTACDSGNEKLAEELNIDCSNTNANWSATVANEIEQVYNNFYSGTGLELLKKLSEVEAGNTAGKIDGKISYYFGKWGDRSQGTGGLYFLKNNLILQSFASDLDLNSTVKGFTAINQSNTAPNFFTTSSLNVLNSNIQEALNIKNGYGINIFTRDDFIEGCNEQNASSLGRDYNENYTNPTDGSHCCPVGKKYDSYTNTCGASTWSTSKSFTPTGTTTTYTYTASPSVNICKNSTVNSTINNLSSCSYKKNNGSETKLTGSSLADCVLYNQKYFVGTYAGNDVYCMETLNTNFSNFRLNFASKYSSGKFIPISKYPSLTKNVTCYAPGSSDTSLYTYLNTSGIKNLTTNMKVKVNFLNENNYQFVNSSKNITENNKSTGKTSYGTNYTSLNFNIDYNYSYVNDSLNKYIKIQNAQGSIDKINSRYKTMTQKINFNIPTDTEPGTYSTSISLSGLDSNVSNITNGTDYTKNLTAGGTSYCKISYEANIDIGSCKDKFNSWKENGTVVGYDASWGNGLCEIEITYSGFTEANCDGISKSNIAIKTNYFTSGNTTKLKFVNNSASSNISCSFNIDVGKKIEDILIYRPIDLSNPFPGKNGNGRTAGSNWSKSDITNYITSRQDAYTKQPMYSFTLTPSNIKTIREYNKKHTYDDFNLNCRGEGSACFSEFIATYKGMMNKDKSSCYFATPEERTVTSFNSCADYTKR